MSKNTKIVDDPIDLDRTLRGAWRTLMANKAPAILAPLLTVGVVVAVVGVLVTPVVGFAVLTVKFPASSWLPARGDLELYFMGWQALMTAAILPLTAWIGLGLTAVYLKLVRRRRPTPRDLFGQARLIVPAIIAYTLGAAAQNMAVFAFFIGAIVMQMALLFAVYFILDRGLGPIAALQASFQVTWSFRTLLKLIVVSLLLQVGTALTCGVGAVLITPWLLLIFTRIYVVLSTRTPCLHCGARVAPRAASCPRCGQAPRDAPQPPEGEEPLALEIPATPSPAWLTPVALVLLIPLIAQGGSPYGAAWLGLGMAPRYLQIHPLLGLGMGLGLVCVPLVAALWLLVHDHTTRRKVTLDEAGAWFGGTDRWQGTRIPWRDVQGFRLTGADGVRLQLKRKPWTRWVGPTIPSQDRATHDLVVALEARRIYNLAGRA